ncbi:MAG: FkbM family methyltransferase [Deltaproteobacteria bacterium]|jgi:FkbM family methyltransferase|nr:FkbM family methyltransferase [Deltaproteobacteria bacterium]
MFLSLETGGISYNLYMHGKREDDHREIFLREIENEYRILDIGANIGYYALMEAILVGKRGRVFAFEPDQRNLELLNANVKLNNLNSVISIYGAAISNRSGMKNLAVHDRSNLNVLINNDRDFSEYEYSLKVQTFDIYELLQEIGKVNLIRMDIEGHEVEILDGIIRLIRDESKFVPEKIVFEVHTESYDNKKHNMRNKLVELFNNGYRIKTLSSQDEDQSIIKTFGYFPWKSTFSDEHKRGLYNNIRNDHALELICDTGGVRIALLSRIF